MDVASAVWVAVAAIPSRVTPGKSGPLSTNKEGGGMLFPCVVTGCAAMAEKDGGQCAVRAAGYSVATYGCGLRCSQCRKLLSEGQAYRKIGTEVRHANLCKVHPDVAKEQKETVRR